MKTFLKNIWASITKDPNLINRLLLILLVIAVLAIAILLSGPKPTEYPPTITPTPVPTGLISIFPSPTRAPSPEYVPATGVIVAVIAVVLIVAIGTVIELIANKNRT